MKNYLFVDGRYTLQANNQSGKIFDVITFPNKMPFNVFKNKKLKIGFDSRIITKKTLEIFFGKNRYKFQPSNKNLVDEIWRRRIKKNNSKF